MTGKELDNLIARINELAKKSKMNGLNEDEKKEQAELRAKYLDNFRKNFRKQLDNIDVKQADGTIINLGERSRNKNK